MALAISGGATFWTSSGLIHFARTPRPNTAHVFQKELENGALVTVALRDYGGNDPRVVGEILRALSQTFVAVY